MTADALEDAAGLATTLRNRVGLLASRASGGTRSPGRGRLIAALIPEATGPMPTDMTHALGELKDLIGQRAIALATAVVSAEEAWLRDLGPAPTRAADRAAWNRELATVIAYRDRYGITDPSVALGPATGTRLQRADRQRAFAAIRRAQHRTELPTPTATRQAAARHGLER